MKIAHRRMVTRRHARQQWLHSPRAGGGRETIRLLAAQKVAESLFAKYTRIALATFRKFDDSFGYAVVGVKTAQSRLTAARAISNATPMIRVVSGSNF